MMTLPRGAAPYVSLNPSLRTSRQQEPLLPQPAWLSHSNLRTPLLSLQSPPLVPLLMLHPFPSGRLHHPQHHRLHRQLPLVASNSEHWAVPVFSIRMRFPVPKLLPSLYRPNRPLSAFRLDKTSRCSRMHFLSVGSASSTPFRAKKRPWPSACVSCSHNCTIRTLLTS